MIRLFVGLGNPGPEYEATRHNAGFWWIDALARRWNCHLQPDRAYHGLIARTLVGGQAVWLLQPMTYMNLSGKSVAALARFFKVEPAEILVVHDELDLLPGQMKLKQGGGAAGHNGLKDIQAQLGSPDTWRLRLGIGHPGVRSEVAAFVLRKPLAAEREAIEGCIAKSMDHVELMQRGELIAAQQKLHAQPPRPKPPKPPKTPNAPADGDQAVKPEAP